ncbi:MAG: hypothetical protein J7M34_04020, partial [Anaerolineae bacterium]|nr:hypothetical protein [Anaerolineae bacterium]
MTIELAPGHKVELMLSSPLILASGMIGYGDARARALDISYCGAWVTAPIGLAPRSGPPTRAVEISGGIVLSETGQNPGVERVLRRYRALWRRMEIPTIARLWGSAGEQAAVAERLETAQCVAALELAPDEDVGPDG